MADFDEAAHFRETTGQNRLVSEVLGGWQPIETAPTNGADLLVWEPWPNPDIEEAMADGEAKNRCGNCYFAFHDLDSVSGQSGWWDASDYSRRIQPTHWMPEPSGPHD